MIGLGKWKGTVDSMFYRGDAFLTISDNNGTYGFEIEVNAGVDIPEFKIYDVVEDGDTLTGKAEVALLPGKEIDLSFTFTDDTFEGVLKVPYLGKIKVKNGVKLG